MHELEGGGYGAMLHDLQHTLLTGFNLRVVPHTPLLKELAGLDVDRDSMVAWWRDALEDGHVDLPDGAAPEWTALIRKDSLYGVYTDRSACNGVTARNAMLHKDQWAKRLNELVGGGLISKRRSNRGVRDWMFVPRRTRRAASRRSDCSAAS